MSKPKELSAVAFALILTGALSACAVYEKCGFAGCPGDSKITAEVEARLRQHPAVEPPNLVRVQTLDHVVYLTGQVDTELERSIAESAAHEVAGVTRVVNSINLSYAGR
jgi:osmotically-inducible protein OsmY